MLEIHEHRRVLQRHRRNAGRQALLEARRAMRHRVEEAHAHREALGEARARMSQARTEHRTALEHNRWLMTVLKRLEEQIR